MRDLARSLLDHLDTRRDELVDFVAQLARAESPSTDGDSQNGVMEPISERLEAAGYEVRRLPGRIFGPQLFARPKTRTKGDPCQLVIGHSDTVWPHGTIADMPVEIREDRLHGPGVFDMKAGLAQMLFALEAMASVGVEPSVTPVIFINSDEEIGSPESVGRIRKLARVANRALVLEPALGPSGHLKTARKGGGRFVVTVKGRSAHAGLDPGSGASAIVELSHVIQALHALNDYERGVSVNVGTIEGGERANVVAAASRAVVDVRVITMDDAREIEGKIRAIRAATPDVELSIDGAIRRPPMERTAGSRILWQIAREAASHLDFELEEALAGGTSDGNLTNQFCPTLDGLGAVGDGAHAHHEYVYIDRLAERASLLALLLLAPPLPARSESMLEPREAAPQPAGSPALPT